MGTSLKAEGLLTLAVDVTGEQLVNTVLDTIVRGMSAQPGIALARIWLLAAGDLCSSCFMRVECRDQSQCLHLAASAGTPLNSPQEDWSFLNGHFRRIPLHTIKVGQVATTRNPILVKDFAPQNEWIARPEWAEREGIRSFAGHPLIFRDKFLGVFAVFSRNAMEEQEFTWLRMFANQAAVAIANAQTFEEVQRLRQQLELENAYLAEQVKEAFEFGEIIGSSPALNKALEQIRLVAPTDATVLITGESGTGKELAARAIHEHSRRRERPLITVNCASIPRELFESEFFGHTKGAFTGALRDRVGRFQLADGGTIFLDEVGEIPQEQQSKLLRVLQEGTFERVGDHHVRHVDVRVIAATNRDLKADAEAERFRADLYYRLCVFPVHLPPLRERREDILPLAERFLHIAAHRLKCSPAHLTHDALMLLEGYDWPGNVRELQNVIERAVILAQNGSLPMERVLSDLAPVRSLDTAHAPARRLVQGILSKDEMKLREKQNILAALEKTQGKIYGPGGAAEMLGMKPTTLASRIKKIGIAKVHAPVQKSA